MFQINRLFLSLVPRQNRLYLVEKSKLSGKELIQPVEKVIKRALKENNLTVLVNEAVQQREVGADILDINVGLPEINESKVLISLIKEIQTIINTPLQIDSSNYEAIRKRSPNI